MSENTRRFIAPQFGPLQGMRVISAGQLCAGPYAGTLMAQYGAEVINIERPGVGDLMRLIPPYYTGKDGHILSTTYMSMTRNRLSMELSLKMDIPESRDTFYDLLRNSDVFLENLVWLKKYGISDEKLLEINPKLVICHVSGFGQPEFGGLPEMCDRASFDMLGQAYSGFLDLQGQPEPAGPSPVNPFTNDFFSTLFALIGILAAYNHAKETGEGQSVDVAQFEAQAAVMADTFTTYTLTGNLRHRVGGTKVPTSQPYGSYKAKDGWVSMAVNANGDTFPRFLEVAGFDKEYFAAEKCARNNEAIMSERGREFDKAIDEWVGQHTIDEVCKILGDAHIPVSPVHNAKTALEDPHWIARGDVVEFMDEQMKVPVKDFGISPKFSATPGKIWRGSPWMGQDTKRVLKEILGYDDAYIQQLVDAGVTRIPEGPSNLG